MRVLVLLWHPKTQYITAGGYLRTNEILKRFNKNVKIDIIDSNPSLIAKKENIYFYNYKIPNFILVLEKKFFVLERILEWFLTIVFLTTKGIYLTKKNKYDVIYIPCSELIITSLAAFFIKKILRHKNVVFCNLNIRGVTLVKLNILIHNKIEKIITLSQDLKEELINHGIKTKIYLNSAGLNTELIKKIKDYKKIYDGIFIGRHTKEKGVFDLIKIWEEVIKVFLDAKLILIGSCNSKIRKEINQKIKKEAMEKNIILKGETFEKEKIKLLKQSKICIFPSYVEGWGIVPQEALACGLPVIAYNLPIYQENIASCQAVNLVEIGNIQKIANKIIELLRNNNWQKYKEIGPKFVEKFDWEKISQKEFEILIKDIKHL